MSDQETIVAEETTENAAEIAVEEQAPEPVSEASESPNGSSTPASLENQESVSEAVPADDSSDEDDSVSIHNLKPGQKLVGTVKNITSFGAFVNIGLAQDGLVHISELSKQKVENVTDVVSAGLQVDIWVKKVDKKRGRISLTMVKPVTRKFKNIQEDDELVGTVTRLEPYGAFIDIDSDREGLVHISQVTHDYIKHPEEALTIGDTVNVKVLKVNRKKRQVDLSIKALLAPPAPTEAQIFEKQQTAKENIVPEEDEEPTPTAMALAFASFQVEQQPEETRVKEKSVKKKSKEMDAIVARTLATQDI
jgi:small subunit ribosomal protein S1